MKVTRTSAASRRPILAIGLVALACLLLGPTNALAKAKQPAKPIYWGAVIGKQLTGEAPPWDMNALAWFEGLAKKGASLLAFSAPFADCNTNPCAESPFPTQAMEALRLRGTIPVLTWASQSVPTPSNLREPNYQLKDIIRGAHDVYIRHFAEQVKEWDESFFLRFDQEMNGFWFPWGEEVNGNRRGDFVKAWRHVHDIFSEVGATKVTWVWCPNVDFTRKLTPLHSLYPGGRYVDWTCLDGFNWGKTHNSRGWMSFSRVFRSTYKRVLKIAPKKPMMIGEVASEERGGSKPKWIANALKTIPAKFPKVRAMIWFEENDRGMHWPIESSKASRKAFSKAIRKPIYRPNEFQNLEASPIPPPSWIPPPP